MNDNEKQFANYFKKVDKFLNRWGVKDGWYSLKPIAYTITMHAVGELQEKNRLLMLASKELECTCDVESEQSDFSFKLSTCVKHEIMEHLDK